MHSIPFLAIAFAGMSSNVKASEMPGNLALCISDNSGSGIGEERCLDPLDGVLKSLPPTKDGGILETTARRVLNWRYDNGLIRASIHGQGSNGADGLCLGPIANELRTVSSKPYELVLRDCPSNEMTNDSSVKTETRQMRFLITTEGRVQSLAAVLDPATGDDMTSTNPYCLTANIDEKVYLARCSETENQGLHQVFDVYGTYSGLFLMPLRSVWEYENTVEIAYQVETDGARSFEDFFVEITMPQPIDGMSLPSVHEWLVDKFPLGESATGGILSFAPSDYRVEGPMVASIKRFNDENDSLVLSRFFVSKAIVPLGKGPNGSYVIFALLLLAFVGCFLVSSLVEHLCLSRTRADGDGNNDGKTVCMSTEEDEEDEFPLEDIDEDIEEANKENDTEGETDLDESRNSSIEEGSSISSDRQEEVFPKADDDNDERSDGNNETNIVSNV